MPVLQGYAVLLVCTPWCSPKSAGTFEYIHACKQSYSISTHTSRFKGTPNSSSILPALIHAALWCRTACQLMTVAPVVCCVSEGSCPLASLVPLSSLLSFRSLVDCKRTHRPSEAALPHGCTHSSLPMWTCPVTKQQLHTVPVLRHASSSRAASCGRGNSEHQTCRCRALRSARAWRPGAGCATFTAGALLLGTSVAGRWGRLLPERHVSGAHR